MVLINVKIFRTSQTLGNENKKVDKAKNIIILRDFNF